MSVHDLVYSETSLLWTPWEHCKVSCIERCPHFRGKFLLRKHIWGHIAKCPYFRVSFKRGSTVYSDVQDPLKLKLKPAIEFEVSCGQGSV